MYLILITRQTVFKTIGLIGFSFLKKTDGETDTGLN